MKHEAFQIFLELTLEVEMEPTVMLSRLGSLLSPPRLHVIV